MRVFLTGATGFIGSAIVPELINAGHQVLGLARSEAAAKQLAAAGTEAHRGDLTDPASLAAGARACDGVIHTAFIHDFANMPASSATDRDAIDAMGAALAGSDRPLVVTSGIGIVGPGIVAAEEDERDPNAPGAHRLAAEFKTLALAERGVRATVVRLPPSVHGAGDYGFVPMLIKIAREKGISAYVGTGQNRWPAVHRLDAAHLYRLAVEQAAAGSKLHGVGEEGVPTIEIATAIGRHLNIPIVTQSPDEAANHFGWIARFFAFDCPATSTQTQQQLGWQPTQPGLLADLDQGHYFTT